MFSRFEEFPAQLQREICQPRQALKRETREKQRAQQKRLNLGGDVKSSESEARASAMDEAKACVQCEWDTSRKSHGWERGTGRRQIATLANVPCSFMSLFVRAVHHFEKCPLTPLVHRSCRKWTDAGVGVGIAVG